MNTSSKWIISLLVIFILSYSFIIPVRRAVNEYIFQIKTVDEETSYKNRKMVEDTARSMIANYTFATNEYESYKVYCDVPVDQEKCQRALDSKTSANKTATTYNNYILKNKFVWQDNLPSDIFYELVLITK